MILIDSVYINNSGGKTLLEYFIQKVPNLENYIFLIDTRLPLEVSKSLLNKIYVKPGEKNRINAYKQLIDSYSIKTIFCFSNVPPPLKVDIFCNVVIFFHNALLLKSNISSYSYFNRIKFLFKRKYIKFLNKKSYKWVVQTNTMKNSLLNSINIDKENVFILPFFNSCSSSLNIFSHKSNSFIYVADSVPQKNHVLLLETWKILALKYDKYPELILTINNSARNSISKNIILLQKSGINIKNIGVLSSDLILDKYAEFRYLIFPSLIESFGLPLIEACEKGCYIIAADLDYVYDIVEPSGVFDPFDADKLAFFIKNILDNNVRLKKSRLVLNDKIQDLLNLLNNNDV